MGRQQCLVERKKLSAGQSRARLSSKSTAKKTQLCTENPTSPTETPSPTQFGLTQEGVFSPAPCICLLTSFSLPLISIFKPSVPALRCPQMRSLLFSLVPVNPALNTNQLAQYFMSGINIPLFGLRTSMSWCFVIPHACQIPGGFGADALVKDVKSGCEDLKPLGARGAGRAIDCRVNTVIQPPALRR